MGEVDRARGSAAGTMPPWHADPANGEFLNDRRLSAAEKETHRCSGSAAGAPEGDPGDLPAPPQYAEGWTIGQPDAVLPMQEDYPIPASGTIAYQYFEVPTNFTEDKWIQAFEVRPGNRAVVHHVIVYTRPPGAGRAAAPAAPATAGPPAGAAVHVCGGTWRFRPARPAVRRCRPISGSRSDRTIGRRRGRSARRSAPTCPARRAASTSRARRCGSPPARR